jgi:hypothetical protein
MTEFVMKFAQTEDTPTLTPEYACHVMSHVLPALDYQLNNVLLVLTHTSYSPDTVCSPALADTTEKQAPELVNHVLKHVPLALELATPNVLAV